MHSVLAAARTPSFRRCFSQSYVLHSGHNKWSKIKQKKGAADIKKSAVYAKAARDVVVAIRTGGSADPNVNTTLANILRGAKTAGVPRDNIERAIARATGEGGKDASAHVVYEAMVSGSVAVIIECLTDNGNRTIHKLREILNEHNGRFAPVKFLFDKVGRVQVSIPQTDDRDSRIEAVLEAAGSAGGEDFEILEGSDTVEYYCPPESLEAMTRAISGLSGGDSVLSSEYIFRAKDVQDEVAESLEESVIELKDALEENEDCVRVWTTIDSRIRGDGSE
ncbi:hypothetical protein M0805_003058 [Coniferiporia weirii]|nr:hypothetical protein M0805_003058 [Coniferiporia weirii]